MQHKITKKDNLLDEKGHLKHKGYATSLILDYNRDDIKAAKFKIKEWDYYYVGNKDYGIALTVADNSYMGLVSFSFLDFRKPLDKTVSVMLPFTNGKFNMPATSVKGDIAFSNKVCQISFLNDGNKRVLKARHNKFYKGTPLDIDITLTNEPQDSMVIATPFHKAPTAFYYNQKINCLQADGYAIFNGEKYLFNKDNQSFGTLDWGRGVWTYKNTWYWGSLSAMVNDKPFGFNIGYGFGDTSAASENMLFYDGSAHKLNNVTFNIPLKDNKEDYMADWTFTSDDNRFDLTFKPLLDRYANSNIGIICSIQHQVFGEFSGKVVLDDGSELVLDKVVGFAEKVHNKW